MKVLIVARPDIVTKKKAEKLGKKLYSLGFDVWFNKPMCKNNACDIKKFKNGIVITIGGDGTFFWASHKAKCPILPVRDNRLGFLCTVDYEELFKNPEKIKNTKTVFYPRLKTSLDLPEAVNDVVVTRKSKKPINLTFSIKHTDFSFFGDGIIFSTSNGSTAYSLSAGGSVIIPTLDVINIVPVTPFNSKIKPMVVSTVEKIKVSVKNSLVVVDGQKSIQFTGTFTISKGKPLKVLIFRDINFYSLFKQKFLD